MVLVMFMCLKVCFVSFGSCILHLGSCVLGLASWVLRVLLLASWVMYVSLALVLAPALAPLAVSFPPHFAFSLVLTLLTATLMDDPGLPVCRNWSRAKCSASSGRV